MTRTKKITLNDEQLDTIKTIYRLNSNHIIPDKGRIFTECAEHDASLRYDYYAIVDWLVEQGLVEEQTENYGSAALWYYYSVTSEGLRYAKK